MASIDAGTTLNARPHARRGSTGYVAEIQGLRTVALLMVATFHVWFDRVSGGVDVFLFISAYLLTRSLVSKAEDGHRTRPISFLFRKFARLLPLAAIAAVLTLGAVLILQPSNFWEGAAGDAIASTLYVENFRLQAATVDYFAANDALASPFQHYWSLSIQGQVFIIWVMVHFVTELLVRGLRLRHRPALLTVFGIIFAGSLAWSIWLTANNQVYAYFDTWARLWEFSAGSILALVQPWIRLPAFARGALSSVGLVAMIACGFVLPVESSFPGYAALWPVIAASLVIVSADSRQPVGAGRLLAHPLLGRLGDYTYALYLVHWPVLVLYLYASRIDAPGWHNGSIILAISAVLSVLLVHTVEKPVAAWAAGRKEAGSAPAGTTTPSASRANLRNPIAAATSIAVALAGSWSVLALVEQERNAALELVIHADLSMYGANNPDLVLDAPLQGISMVKDDWVNPGPKCDPDDPYATDLCYEIPPVKEGSAERTIITLGNSHTTQFVGTLLEVVERQPSWSLRTQVAPGCNFAMTSHPSVTDDCLAVWSQGSAYIAEQQPDLVVVHATWWNVAAPDHAVGGILEWVGEMAAASPNTEFVLVRDNPRLTISPFDCASDFGWDDPACVAEFGYADPAPLVADVRATGAIWVDLTRDICGSTSTCPPVRGGVFVYLDDNHLTETYARTLAQGLSDQLHARVSWWPADAYLGVRLDRTPSGGIQDELNK